MKPDKIFAATLIAAAFWFVVNPDFHYRTASADRVVALGDSTRDPATATRAMNDVNFEAGALAPSSKSLQAPMAGGPGISMPSRIRYENILVNLAYSSDVCTATVLEAPTAVGSTLTPPRDWQCADGATQIRGSAIYDSAKEMLVDFEPNVSRDNAPFDRSILTRWANYGTLCPNDQCEPTDLVILDDGNVQVRKAGASTLGTEIGKLTTDEVTRLKGFFEKLILTPKIEHRIDDAKTSDPVSVLLNLNFMSNSFIEAEPLHAAVRYPPIPEAKLACAIIEEKTPIHFCDLIVLESIPSPTPSGLPIKFPPGYHNPGTPLPPSHPGEHPPSPIFTPVIVHPTHDPSHDPAHDPSTSPSVLSPAPPIRPGDAGDPATSPNARMMTWNHQGNPGLAAGYIHVGCHGDHECNAYQGDTACSESRALLCIHKDAGIPAPTLPPVLANPYSQWASGEVRSVPNISGRRLTSVRASDAICSQSFGEGWRMAEFHDGWGWGFVAKGNIPSHQSYWVWIRDQPANCWNSH